MTMRRHKTILGIVTLFILFLGGIMLSNKTMSKYYQLYSKCCEENKKECLACQTRTTVAEICTMHPGQFDCSTEYCCNETRKECLACWKGMTVKDFCNMNPIQYQCGANLMLRTADRNSSDCCEDITKKCLSCSRNMTENEFCSEFSGRFGCDTEIMIGIPLSNKVGYIEFTASVWRKYHHVTEKHVHLFKDTSSANIKNEDLKRWYGKDVRIIEPYVRSATGENIRRLFEYFVKSDYKVLLLANVETIFLKGFKDFIKTSITETDGFLSLYHSSVMHNYTVDCQKMTGQFCEGDAFGTYGVALTKEVASIILKNHQKPFDDLNWSRIFESVNISLLYPTKSLSMQIGQVDQAEDNCGQNEVAYRFNRCELPNWIQNGIEFYFDRCTNPNERYNPRISNTELTERNWTRPVVSYCLYGNKRRYIQIARENARRVFSIYPGWKMWIYTDETVPAPIMQELCEFDIRFIDMSKTQIASKMSWRFLVASEPVKMYAIRDIDSYLLMRGKAAVDEWIASGRKFHNMRDNPNHSRYPMSGGMWGGHHDAIPNMKDLLESRRMDNNYMTDMNFLNNVVWKIASKSVWTHDSYSLHKFGEDHPFPTKQKAPDLFVGNVVIWPS